MAQPKEAITSAGRTLILTFSLRAKELARNIGGPEGAQGCLSLSLPLGETDAKRQ